MPSMTVGGESVRPRISDYVTHFAATMPSATAVVCRGRRIDYAGLAEAVDRWAAALLEAGIGKGDRVAMLSAPRAEFWIAFLATAKIGGIWVGLNPRYSLRECRYVVEDAEPGILLSLARFGDTSYAPHVEALLAERPDLRAVAIDGDLPGAVGLDAFLTAGHESVPRLAQVAAAVDTLDPALIVYTSGSTGSPKGAVLTHYGLCFGATMQTTHFRVERPSIVVSFPINHVASVADTCATTLVRGGKIVFQEKFDPDAAVRATASERCTILAGVPTMLQMEMASEAFRDADLSSVEMILWGGAAMPVETIEQFAGLNKRLMTAYGMTETATHVTYTSEGASLDELAHSVGRPDPHCDIRIATASGAAATAEDPGELLVRGEFLMRGYWRREAATREAFTDDGYLKTGDLACWRGDGTIRIVGRKSDMFKSGGYNVYPREIELVLEQHPAVALAAVVAVADPLYQEVGVAYVKPEPGAGVDADALDGWSRERLANYKVPKRFHVLDELPLLPVGKVDKQALKRRGDQPS